MTARPLYDDLPLTDAREVKAFLDRLPLAVDREHFTRFVLGFPQGYLRATPPAKIVKHFALAESLGSRALVSSLAAEGALWKLEVITAVRRALFASLAGSLTVFGADITSAEAFANTEGIVLDTFVLKDTGGRFEAPEARRAFLAYLEAVVTGRTDVESDLAGDARRVLESASLALEWDETAHPSASLLRIRGRDQHGLLHAIARRLAEGGIDIVVAHIATEEGEVRDAFYVTVAGGKLDADTKARVEQLLAASGGVSAA